MELTWKFDFGVFFSIPAYLHFTEIYSVDLLPADSQRGHLFNLYTMLKLELISNSIYIKCWSWNWFRIQFIQNTEVGNDFKLNLYKCWSWNWLHFKIIFTLLKKEKNHFCAFVSLTSIFKNHGKTKTQTKNTEELLQSAKPRQSQS